MLWAQIEGNVKANFNVFGLTPLGIILRLPILLTSVPTRAAESPGTGIDFGPPSLPFHKKGQILGSWCDWTKESSFPQSGSLPA